MKRCKKALQTYKEINDKPGIAKVLVNIGNIFKSKNQYKEAEYYFQESLTILNELGLKKETSGVLNNIGNIYTAWDENEIALKYYQRALKIAEELKNKEDISMVLNNIGLIYKKIGKYSDALKNFTRILDIQNELKSKSIISTIYRNIAEVYEKQDDFQKALYYYKKSYNLMDKKSNELIAGLLNNFGNIYKKLGNYNVALQYLKQSISITDSINKFGNLNIKNHKDISDLYFAINDFKNAYKYQLLFVTLKDSIYNKEIHKQIVEINTKYETERKEKDIKIKDLELKKNYEKIKNQRIIILCFILGFIVFISSLLFVYKYKKLKDNKKRNILKQELDRYMNLSLTQQIKPHFIFNSLNSLHYYLARNDNELSIKFLEKFSDLIRIILNNSQHETIPIQDELDALQLYLELEAIRSKNKFEYSINIASDIDTQEFKIPTLLIQPYVENSIWHGLMHRADKGKIIIEMKKKGDVVLCSIEDNGIGREKAMEFRKKKDYGRQSIGTDIKEKRLNIINSLYKTQMNVTYIDLKDEHGSAKGTRVEINIPVMT
jgi:tetratricopeptide (TPR) repeat protein/anti-sigma regulatory factor (Ser/Thr protein kinase)